MDQTKHVTSVTKIRGLIFKHLKSLTKDSNFPSEMEYDGRTEYTTQNQASIFNLLFNSVFSAKEPIRVEDIKVANPTLTNLSISKANMKSILLELDITKTRGPNGIPPILYQRTSDQMSSRLHKVFKIIKRLKRLPKKGKVAAVSPIYKKGNRKLMNNYRGISLLNIDSKCFEKCMYELLYTHFVQLMSDHQHGAQKVDTKQHNKISTKSASVTGVQQGRQCSRFLLQILKGV